MIFLHPVICWIAKQKYYIAAIAVLLFIISTLAFNAPLWFGIVISAVPLAWVVCSVALVGMMQKATQYTDEPDPAQEEKDEDEARLSIMPQFDFHFGTAQAGVVKRGLTFQMDCSFLFLDADFDGYRFNLVENGANVVTLRRGVDYKALAIRFINTGCGDAHNFGLTATYDDEVKQFSVSGRYMPGEEHEIGLVYARDYEINCPLEFHLSFFDAYGTHYIQDFTFNLDTGKSLIHYERRKETADTLSLTASGI